jgi:hypothetical protein
MKPRRQTSGPHPGAAARNDSRHAVARASQRFHSVPSSTLVDGAASSHFQEPLITRDALPLSRHGAFQHHDHRYDKLPPAGSTGDGCPPQSSAVNRQALTPIPGSRNDALQQHDPEAHAIRGQLSSRDSAPITPDCAAGSRTRSRARRHDVIVLQLAPLLHPLAAGKPRDHSCYKLPRLVARRSLPSDHRAMMPIRSSTRIDELSLEAPAAGTTPSSSTAPKRPHARVDPARL